MEELDLKQEDRKAVVPAREYAMQNKTEDNETPAIVALELPDGTIVTGRESDLMDNCSAGILNAIKHLAGISDEIYLLSPVILNTIQKYKSQVLNNKISTLSLNEILIALSISAVTNPTAQLAYDQLTHLKGVQAHST